MLSSHSHYQTHQTPDFYFFLFFIGIMHKKDTTKKETHAHKKYNYMKRDKPTNKTNKQTHKRERKTNKQFRLGIYKMICVFFPESRTRNTWKRKTTDE